MPILIRQKYDVAKDIEKRSWYRFWDKERERSNHAVQLQGAGILTPSCAHMRLAWSGPPHDKIQSITCLDCRSYATEPEMRDMGFDFDDCPDWEFFKIMDARARQMNRMLFLPNGKAHGRPG